MAGIESLYFDLIARDNASRSFKAVGDAAVLAATKVGKAQTAFERASIRMAAVGDKLSKSLTLPIVALGAVAVDQAAKYQTALNTIAVATDQNAKQIAASSKGLENIAKSTGTSLEQLTTSLYTVEKSGLRGSKALDVVRASAQGAKAEGADLGTATQALTSIMASYGTAMGNPIQAENALIRGAGLAKTSYQDFAASLSNVIPIASSLHISFAQVAGAVDTMTQHGETAQRATENLANLITNLAGQNTVASSAMQQLGINTIDLQKNLGTRGLTGTLAIVDAAMKAHTKNGEIVSSASRDAALATKSLNTELGTFTGSLQTQSKQLLSGKEGILDYQNYAKSLGGTAGASALQFLALYKSSQGFSDQLKSGNGTIRTSAATLQKMLGGVTGMRTALMLGGQSAQRFSQDTSAVAAAADKAGANVLGWSKTQATFNFKLDQAKEAFQVLAVQAGTELLPVLEKLANAGEDATNWVGNLDHNQKEILGWGIGVVAAIGPVLSITGRLGMAGASITRFATSGVSQLGRFNTSIATNAEGISTAVGRIGTAIGAAGLGVAVGELTKNSSTATKSIGVLGSALAGAALGATGGPWGIAIGAAAGAVGDLGTQWLSSGGDAKKAAAQAIAATAAQKQAVENLYQSLVSVNGEYGKQYKQQVINQLMSNGALRAAAAANINPQTVVQATLGNKQAQTTIANQIGADQKGITEYGADGSAQYAPVNQKAFEATSKLNKILIASGAAATGAEKKYELYEQAQGAGVVTSAQLAKGVQNVTSEMKGYGTSLDTSTAYGTRNTAVIQANVQAMNAGAVAALKHGQGVKSVTSDYESQIGTLSANLHQMGFNNQAVDGLIASYLKIPKSVATAIMAQGTGSLSSTLISILGKYASFPKSKNTTLTANGDQAMASIGRVQSFLNDLHSKTIDLTTKITTDQVRNVETNIIHANPNSTPHHAAGGSVADGFFTVGEQGYELGYKHGSKVQIYSNAQSKAMTGMSRVPGFANGTSNNAQHGYPKDASFLIGGESYSTLAKAIAGISAAMDKAARDADGLGKAADQGGSSLRSAFSELLDSAKTAGLDAAERHRLTMIDNKAAQDANRRLAAATKVAALRASRASEVSTIRTAVTGSYQIASAGTGFNGSSAVGLGSILAQGKQAELIAEKFNTGLRKLRKEGLALGVVQQLAEAGPSAMPQVTALLKATPKQLASLNGYESGISAAGKSLGGYVGVQRYGNGSSGEIGRAVREQAHEAKLLRNELKELRKDFREFSHRPEQIDIHIDGKKTQRELVKAERRNDRRK